MNPRLLNTICRATAYAVNAEHFMLGTEGQELTAANRFGDMALVADVRAETMIFSILGAAGFQMRVVSEEHGEFTIGNNPEYTLVIDGLDGSNVYKNASVDDIQTGRVRYGTMFGLFHGTKPRYRDGIISCIVEHPTRRLLMAQTGRGVTVEHLDAKVFAPLGVTASPDALSENSRVFCETGDPTWGARLTEFVKPLAAHGIRTTPTGSTARHYFDVATGGAAATLEWSRKRNLELMIAYLIITEAGGTVIRLDGSGLGQYSYDELAQGPDDMEYFIAAANVPVAEKLRAILNAAN